MKARRVHLGDRIATVEHIRAGRTTVDEAAIHFAVSTAEVRSWLQAHAGDCTLHLDDLRGEPGRLTRQAQRLRHLIARTERTLHVLHAQLLPPKTQKENSP